MSDTQSPELTSEKVEKSPFRSETNKSTAVLERPEPPKQGIIARAMEAARLTITRKKIENTMSPAEVNRLRQIHQLEQEGARIAMEQRNREVEAAQRRLKIAEEELTVKHRQAEIAQAEKNMAIITNKQNVDEKHEYKRQAETSEKTGLSTERVFEARLQRAGERMAQVHTKGRLVIALFDLNNLGVANERGGHPGGDALLLATGEALAEGQREHEQPSYIDATYKVEANSHLHGDEFAVVLEDVTDDIITENGEEKTVSGAKIWGLRKAETLKNKKAILPDGTVIADGISLGGGYIEVEPEELFGKSPEEVKSILAEKQKQADEALFAAKHLSKERNKQNSEQGLPENGFAFVSYAELQNMDDDMKQAIIKYRDDKAKEKANK
jgi:GGDEF domain-containing protein